MCSMCGETTVQVNQVERNECERKLREHVKWVTADSRRWLNTVEERISHLSKASQRLLRFEEEDDIALESRDFLLQVRVSISAQMERNVSCRTGITMTPSDAASS